MAKPYLVLVNGRLYDRTMTKKFALKVIAKLQLRGIMASLAYDHTGLYGKDL